MGALPFWDVGQIASIPDLVPYDEFREGRFFREWVEPQGWIDAANTVLEKSVTSCAYLSIIRGKAHGMVDDEMRQRMALITPHVRRAVLIGRVIDLKQVQATSFADALDGISAGLFLVDANAHVILVPDMCDLTEQSSARSATRNEKKQMTSAPPIPPSKASRTG